MGYLIEFKEPTRLKQLSWPSSTNQ